MTSYRDMASQKSLRGSKAADKKGVNKSDRPDQTVRGGKDESVPQYKERPQQNSVGPGFKSPPWGKDY